MAMKTMSDPKSIVSAYFAIVIATARRKLGDQIRPSVASFDLSDAIVDDLDPIALQAIFEFVQRQKAVQAQKERT